MAIQMNLGSDAGHWYYQGKLAAQREDPGPHRMNEPNAWEHEENRLACLRGYNEERLKRLLMRETK